MLVDERSDSNEETESLVASRSDGHLSIIRPCESTFVMTNEWHGHDFEPWIASWDCWDTNIIYSGDLVHSFTYKLSWRLLFVDHLGGDDCKLKVWDVRQGFTQAAATNKRYVGGPNALR